MLKPAKTNFIEKKFPGDFRTFRQVTGEKKFSIRSLYSSFSPLEAFSLKSTNRILPTHSTSSSSTLYTSKPDPSSTTSQVVPAIDTANLDLLAWPSLKKPNTNDNNNTNSIIKDSVESAFNDNDFFGTFLQGSKDLDLSLYVPNPSSPPSNNDIVQYHLSFQKNDVIDIEG